MKVYGKETEVGVEFAGHSTSFLFSRSKFSRGSGGSSNVPVSVDSWLDPRAACHLVTGV